MMRKHTGLTVVALALGVVRLGAQQADGITLEDAIQRALRAAPAMVQALGDVRNAGASSRSALGAYLPNLSTSYAATKNNANRVDQAGQILGPGLTHSVGLSASIDLFNGFRREATLRSTAATKSAADAGYVNQRFQVTLQTKQTFYTALATSELVRVAEAQLKRAQQQHSVAVEKLRAGSATRSDSLRTRVELGNAQLGLLQARANLANAEASLGRLVGATGPVRALADSGLVVQPAELDTAGLREEAGSHSPLVEQAEAQAGSARASVWAQRSQYWPTLNLSYRDNRSGIGSPFQNFNDYRESISWSISLNWTLFNGFSREASQVSASAARDLAEARAADMRRQVDAQLTQQLAVMDAAAARIDVTRASLVAAEEDLRVQQQRYQVGASTILEVLNSQVALSQAEVNLIQARFDYLIARAQVEAVVGRAL